MRSMENKERGMRISATKAVLSITAAIGASVATANAAVVLTFNNATVDNPFNRNQFGAGTSGVASVSGSITDPSPINGDAAASATLTFANPVTGRTVTNGGTLSATASGSGTTSFFMAESGGFGVGDSTTGRFNTGEAFTLTSTQAFKINSISFAEYSGDEYLNFSFLSGGNPVSTTVFVNASAFADVSTVFATTPVDANAPLRITNVSGTGASLGGRLRFTGASVSLVVPEPTTLGLVGLLGLAAKRRR
jgi:hypothetical protein